MFKGPSGDFCNAVLDREDWKQGHAQERAKDEADRLLGEETYLYSQLNLNSMTSYLTFKPLRLKNGSN